MAILSLDFPINIVKNTWRTFRPFLSPSRQSHPSFAVVIYVLIWMPKALRLSRTYLIHTLLRPHRGTNLMTSSPDITHFLSRGSSLGATNSTRISLLRGVISMIPLSVLTRLLELKVGCLVRLGFHHLIQVGWDAACHGGKRADYLTPLYSNVSWISPFVIGILNSRWTPGRDRDCTPRSCTRLCVGVGQPLLLASPRFL